MQIKLYSENDTRPVGSYEFASSAYVSPFSILFVSQTGVQILSSLRFKITLDPGDQITHSPINQVYEIIGVTKKQFEEIKDATTKRKAVATSGISEAVPQSSSFAGNDTDEVPQPRRKRKATPSSDRGSQSDLFPAPAARID